MILAPFGLKCSGQGEIIGTWPRVHKYNKGTQISFRLALNFAASIHYLSHQSNEKWKQMIGGNGIHSGWGGLSS
jgi:hypothetical protein